MKQTLILLLTALTVQAQLVVTVSPVKVTGQKAIVPLALKNNFTEPVQSAKAVLFLLDEQGKLVGQSTKWVIGGTKDRPPLEPRSETTFNFVIPSSKPFTATNVTAKVNFTRVVLEGGKLADISQQVTVTRASK